MSTYRAYRKARTSLALALVVAMGLLVSSCSSATNTSQANLKLVGNFYPITWLVERIAGDAADVTSLTPNGVEPHDLQLDAKSVALIQEANLVFYLGLEFQPEVEKAISQLADTSKAIDLLKSPGVTLLDVKEEEDGHDHEEGEDHDHEGEEDVEHKHPLAGGKDPHVWLDPANMTLMAKAISSELKKIAPDFTETFESNFSALEGELNGLDNDISSQLANCEIKTVVTSHAAFLYFTEKYGFEQLAIAGISPEDEPDAKRLAGIADSAKDAKVKTVYFEEVLSPALAKTVAQEVGAELSFLSALEFAPESGDYISQMRSNLQNLFVGQDCSK